MGQLLLSWSLFPFIVEGQAAQHTQTVRKNPDEHEGINYDLRALSSVDIRTSLIYNSWKLSEVYIPLPLLFSEQFCEVASV